MTLAEIYTKQKKEKENQSNNINLVLHIPEVGMLIKHLDKLYATMILNQQENESQSMTRSWFNPGQGSVKQSESVT